jgi:large subunit ribosomal protein L1
MDKQSLIKTLKELKKDSKKKFNQSVDLIIALKDLNLKKPEDQVEFFAHVPYETGKKKICAFVGRELLDQAKEACDFAIDDHDFPKYQEKKNEAKKLGRKYDFFIAQANIMANVAKVFGRALGTRGKMPNPKAGCVVPPNANLKQVAEKLQKTIKVSAKKAPVIQIKIGTQNMDEEHVAENILSVYKQVLSHLPKEKHNLKVTYIKLTMSKPVKI